MSREFTLTGKGKKESRIPSRERDPIIDHLHEFKTATYEELTSIVGRENVSTKVRDLLRQGIIQEQTNTW